MAISSRFVALGFFLVVLPQTPVSIPVAPFSSINLPDGGHVIVRESPTQRVTLIQGNRDLTRIEVTDRGMLMIVDNCDTKCPRGYELEVEILTPRVASLAISNGGWIRTVGSFSGQSELSARVAHGGTIDARSMLVDNVNAAVEQGGRIFTSPRTSLTANVYQGGVVLYWGNPRVQRSIRKGGVVQKGTAAEFAVPLEEAAAVVEPVHSIRSKH
ncbi:MAG TPA: DUF2807 domain-containing protein [Gemmatimonadaceae bacterium]|jgi:hypothetical protein|nr:DUF2807 domain-containing protein [Gemmatimonadaceae bacterium]